MNKAENIDDYIGQFPSDVQKKLKKIRSTIKKALPESEEAISYAIPTLKVNKKNVVHFAAFAKHIGVYPVPRDDKKLLKEIEPYIKGKGTMQFPLNEPMPYELIGRIAKALHLRIVKR